MAKIYYVRTRTLTGKPYLIEGDSENKTQNLEAWSTTEAEAWEKYEEREKIYKAKQAELQERAEKIADKFTDELSELLSKYDARVYWSCGEFSDTHGIYDEKMVVEIGGREVEICQGNELDL